MAEPEWELLKLFMYVENMRKHPIQLKHVRSHTQQTEPVPVGNATADLVAETARLFSPEGRGRSIHGSRKVNKEATTASWAAILHDDAYEENWEELDERRGRKPRHD